jgi:putative colanic acid biosynthesis acetyltransferase WcaF
MPRHHGKRYYSNKEILLRVVWGIVEPLFFRYSPRLLYGWRNFLLRMMGARIGKRVQVFPSVRIMAPWLLEIGDHSVISWGVKVYNLGKITIGHDTVISQYSHLCGGTHDYESDTFTLLRTGLTIGSHVWIAADAFIGPDVHVNDHAVVAARAVVIHDVDRGAVVGGNPARLIKMRSGI